MLESTGGASVPLRVQKVTRESLHEQIVEQQKPTECILWASVLLSFWIGSAPPSEREIQGRLPTDRYIGEPDDGV